jgi:hypothetical protein
MSMLESLFTDTFREPAECLIKVDKTEISHLYAYVSEVTVTCSRREGCRASIRFETRRDENGEWLVQDDDALIPWKEIEIIAAFGASREEQVMIGYIQQINASYPDQQCTATATVICRDRSLLLDREHRRELHGTEETPSSDNELLQTVLGNYPELSTNSANDSGQSSLIQVNRDGTDIQFLRQRARLNGYELLFEGDELYFGPMRVDDKNVQPPIKVYAGPATNCINFNIGYDGHHPDQVCYELANREEGGSTQQVVESDVPLMGQTSADSSTAGHGSYSRCIVRPGAMVDDELKAAALGQANDAAMKIHAQGQLDGKLYGHVLRVGLPVIVDGVGTRYSGTYYVDSVTHRFTAEGYKQDFRLLRNAHGEDI